MATTPQAASKSPTIRRILREAAEISNAPSSDYTAEPLESDLFEWHFTLRGPPKSPYAEGVYHGRIVLPASYPLRPPSFRFMTPNGRFEANREICLSISGHHEETWQPAWGIRTAIVALRSFMETSAAGQLGGYDATDAVRKRLAAESPNFKCSLCNKTNRDIIKECEERAAAEGASEEVQVPKELNMGFKDEMEAKKKAAAGENKDEEEEERARLAEGFVQTIPLPSANAERAATAEASGRAAQGTIQQPALRQVRRVPQPTSTIPLPAQPVQAQIAPRRSDHAGVPVWLDRLLVVLVALLAFLVLRVMFDV